MSNAAVKGRSFTLLKLPPTPVMQSALEHCVEKALNDEPVSQMSIMEAIGSRNTTGGTSAGVLGRLEDQGYIERRFYQRGLQVHILELGLWTAPPSCTAPHWRERNESVPAPAIQAVRERRQSIAMQMEADARERGVSFAEHLIDLAYIGHHEYRRERDEG